MKVLTFLSLCLFYNSACSTTTPCTDETCKIEADFIDLFTERFQKPYKWPYYRSIKKTNCTEVLPRDCDDTANNFEEYANKCIEDGCRPAVIHHAQLMSRIRGSLYPETNIINIYYYFIGMSDNNSAKQMRWINGQAVPSSIKELIRRDVQCKEKDGVCQQFCFAVRYAIIKRVKCTSPLKVLCECRAPYRYLENKISGIRAVFNTDNKVMGGFSLENTSKLSIRGTIATGSFYNTRVQIVLYDILSDNRTFAEECTRAVTEMKKNFLYVEEVNVNDIDYFASETTKTKVVREHANLGGVKFLSKTSSIVSIDVKDLPKLDNNRLRGHKYFIVIWLGQYMISCAGVKVMNYHDFFKKYNKALVRYATGIDVGMNAS